MKKTAILCVGIAAAIALSGCATKKQLDVTNGQLQVIQIQLSVLNQIAADAANQLKQRPAQEACMLGGQPYSEGAVAAERTCKRILTPGGKTDGEIIPVPNSKLVWLPESTIRIN